MSDDLVEGRQPLYATLASTLRGEILDGKYSPSNALPSEEELAELFKVSRNTVRQALRDLRDEGFISSHPGIGTIVRKPVRNALFHPVNSIDDLLQFIGNTQLKALAEKEIFAGDNLCKKLGFDRNLPMAGATFIRHPIGTQSPMGYVMIYVQPRYAEALVLPPDCSTPVYQRIEQLFDVRVAEIRQDVSAVSLNAEFARALQTRRGSAALQIRRYFYGVDRSLLQASISYFPSCRYVQSTRFPADTGRSAVLS
ncbi:hypothetical protein BH09PSE6_BH09PSE6_12140 [soil metagenome]